MKAKKPHALKGRKYSAEQLAQRAATREANRLARLGNESTGTPDEKTRMRDAVVYLTNANKHFASITKPGREMSAAQLLVQLALKTLRGEL